MKDRFAMAFAFAAGAHGAIGQKRKYTGVDYIQHPMAVSKLVASVGGTDSMVCAALLHDVVEDTKIDLSEIEEMFGEEVAALVEQVTDISRPEDGNRAKRKKIDLDHIARSTPDAKTIKLADLIDNTSTIVKHDPEFAKVYMREKRDLLGVLKDGNEALYKRAADIVDEYFSEAQ